MRQESTRWRVLANYHNNGRMKNPNSGNTFFETDDLSPDIYFAIDTLKTEGLTNAIEFTTPQGETMYRSIRLDSRSKPHRASLQEDYSRIQQLAKEGKKNEYLAKWLDEKYGQTFNRSRKRIWLLPYAIQMGRK